MYFCDFISYTLSIHDIHIDIHIINYTPLLYNNICNSTKIFVRFSLEIFLILYFIFQIHNQMLQIFIFLDLFGYFCESFAYCGVVF